MYKLLDIYSQAHSIVTEWIPRVAPDLEATLTPAERVRFLNHEFDQYATDPLLREMQSDKNLDPHELSNLNALASNNHLINVIEALQDSYEHKGLLLTALVISKEPSHWAQAETLLKRYGKPFHYSRLAFSAWSKPDMSKAIELANEALSRYLNQSQELNDPLSEFATEELLKNNLAFYYAEKGDKIYADEARKLVINAIALQKKRKKDHPFRLANYTDTKGFVTIVFAENADDIADGIKTCEDARRLGGPYDMYFDHIRLAESRLRELKIKMT